MDNLKLPASPQSIAFHPESSVPQTSYGLPTDLSGFTKLELASLMIAQGMLSGPHKWAGYDMPKTISINAVAVAKSILEEANK